MEVSKADLAARKCGITSQPLPAHLRASGVISPVSVISQNRPRICANGMDSNECPITKKNTKRPKRRTYEDLCLAADVSQYVAYVAFLGTLL